MPVCKLIPGFTDQCEKVNAYWDDLDQDSKDRCMQNDICGPIQPHLVGGKRKNRRMTKKARRQRRRSSRKN